MVLQESANLLLKAQGARILSELNDLKRTAESCADEVGWDREEVNRLLQGKTTQARMMAFVDALVDAYPIDRAELLLVEDDCDFGVKIMRDTQSRASARVFNRQDRHGNKTPYYEYRDTAMSRLSAFRPEWIEELRVVDDNDPNNPDVAYNNGHFMHQVTFFVGPVNFYYEIDGVRRCEPMNTGDSNYITPYWAHSFTSRDASQQAYIIAVTFGGDVKRALGELYRYGKARAEEFLVDVRHPAQGIQDLLDFHLNNEFLTRELLQAKLKASHPDLGVDVLNRTQSFTPEQTVILAECLNIQPQDLMLPVWDKTEEVVVKKAVTEQGYAYPSASHAAYHMYPTARCRRMPQVKSFDIHVNTQQEIPEAMLKSALHTYLYNYSDSSVQLSWNYQDQAHRAELAPGDSAYVQPWIAYQLANVSSEQARIFMVGIPGAVNLGTQKEMSSFANFSRVIEEDKCWFNA